VKIKLTAGPPAYGGYTVARLDGKVVMLKGAIPGETVEAEVLQEKKDYSVAAAINILEPSPERVEPPCPYFGVCGGCQIQYASYPMQIGIKKEVLASALRRIGKMDVTLAEPLTGQPWNYRRRGQFKISGGRVGYFREHSRELVDIDRCPLMVDEINGAFINAKRLLKNTDASELHICRGDVSLALIKVPRSTRHVWKDIAKELLDAGFAGVRVEIEGKKPLIFGAGKLGLDLDGIKYSVSPESFFQANWGLNRALVGLVLDGLKPMDGKTVLDLYAGAGNFSLPVSRLARKVVAVEEGRSSVMDAKENVKANGISNCEFVRCRADGFDIREEFDAVILDPPRAGITEAGIGKILSTAPGRIAYVSCNPATFARDLNKFQKDYKVESLRMVDFFPQTYHIEAMALLTRRS
jgi:23S rRNA (uracil1939-C5)-methyltransferase